MQTLASTCILASFIYYHVMVILFCFLLLDWAQSLIWKQIRLTYLDKYHKQYRKLCYSQLLSIIITYRRTLDVYNLLTFVVVYILQIYKDLWYFSFPRQKELPDLHFMTNLNTTELRIPTRLVHWHEKHGVMLIQVSSCVLISFKE